MWWLLITVMLLINIVIGRHIPQTLFQLFCYYSGIGWWMFHNEPFGIYYYEWYIPTLLLFYLLLPLLYKLDNRKIFLVFILSIICVLFLLFFNIDKRLSLSYTRIPTFIYGIILYKMYNKEFKEDFTNKYLIISSLLGVLLLSMSIYYKGLSQTQTLGFMLVLPVFLYICCNLFKGVIGKVISFIGTLTLELYLLHIYDLPLIAVLKVINNKTIAIMIAVIILVGISYLLQYSMNRILSKVIKGNTI